MHTRPLYLAETSFLEDPAMGHTQKMLLTFGLAEIWHGEQDEFPSESTLARVQERMAAERRQDEALFGAFAHNGVAFVAHSIQALDGSIL